jgi:hypothetical protein
MRAWTVRIAALAGAVVIGLGYVAWRAAPAPLAPQPPPESTAPLVPSGPATPPPRAELPERGDASWLDVVVDEEPDAFAIDVGYDCSGLPFEVATAACDDTPTPLSRLVEASENDPFARTEGPDDADWALWRDAVRVAKTIDPSSLSVEERVVAQNAALRMGVRSIGGRESDARNDIARDCARLVQRLALPAGTLVDLGDAPTPEVDQWLGPRDRWIDKRPFLRPLMHDSVFAYSMAFRPLQAGHVRAMMGQLVAVDTDGLAHVTPLVGKIELRRGHAHVAPACVLVRDPRLARCGVPAGLRAVLSLDHLPKNTFFHRVAPGRVGCEACHAGSSPLNLGLYDAGDALEQMRDRRVSFLSSASGRAADLAALR